MRIIEQLVYKITGDNSEFDKSIDKSETKVNKFGSVADKMLAGVTVAAIGMVVKKMGDMVISSANALDRVDKLSQKIGLSRVAFQEWDYILGQSGASVEGLQMGIKTLSNAADEAKKGTALYAESFDKLGVSVTDTNGKMKDQEILFSEVFSALADMENQTERTAIANKLLGRSATELAPTLNTSKEEIEQLRKEAHDLGVVYSDELIDAGVLLGDNIERLTKAFDGLKTKALAPIIGLAVTFTEKLLGQNTASNRLTTSTNNLASATDSYKTITSQLKNPIDNLTEAEKALLEIQQKRAELKLNQAVIELGKNYADTQRQLLNLQNDEKNYQTTIEQSLAVINKYTPQQREEIRNYVQQGRAVTDMTLKKRELLTAEDDLKRAQVGLLSTQAKLIDENGNFNASITQIAQGVIDQQVELSTLANINAEFAESVRNQVKALQARDIAIADATEAFKAYSNVTEDGLRTLIKATGRQKESAYNTEIVRLATEKLNEILAEKAKLAEAEAEKEEARAEIIANTNKAISDAEKVSIALGEAYDLTSAKAGIFTSAIETLIESGLEPSSKEVQEFVTQLNSLTLATEEATEALGNSAVEAFKKSAQSRADAYKEIDSYRQSDYSKEMQAIREKAEAFLKAGVEEVDVAEWQSEQWDRIHKAQADKAEEEAKRARDAWIDYAFDVGGSIASMWSLINKVQANNNAQLIATLEKTTAETLKNIDAQTQAKLEAEGVALETTEERLRRERDEALATGDTITANLKDQEIRRNEIIAEAEEEKRLIQEESDKQKIAMQREDVERKKAIGTFQAIIDTASAVIGFLANPGGFAGVGLSAMAAGVGAAQIAAIQSEPLPSFDVGSIRIPETTQAVVHKDEMILTAPQAEQARREGITIAPNKASGNSVNLVIYLDGKEIARNTIDNLNSGSVGTIKARVVK
jgi:hypothetical protein